MGVKSGRRVGLTTLPPSVSRMSEIVGASTSRKPKGLHGLHGNNFTFTLQTMILLRLRSTRWGDEPSAYRKARVC
jgi:hypothetical protein